MSLQNALRRSRLPSLAPNLLSHFSSTAFVGDFLSIESMANGVAVVRLDDKSAKVNTLSAKMTGKFLTMLDTIENDPSIKSVVLISAKPGCFIAGADIGELRACKSEDEVRNLSINGQKFMNRIANSKKPFVAAIDGSCMGGGLEVALACHYRIATQSKKTKLSLPEVMLGLLPGAGGTQRLPKLIGLRASLDMMLTGKNILPDKAKKIGLIDQVADSHALEGAAIVAAEQLSSGSLKRKTKKKSITDRILEDTPFRSILFQKAGETVQNKTGGHYPAPKLILESVKAGVEGGLSRGLEAEANNFGKLGVTSESKALMSIFFGQNQLKKNRFGAPKKKVETVAVIGAGLMGAGIAQVTAVKGMRVLLKDRDLSASYRGEEYVRSNLEQKVKRKKMSIFDRDCAMSKIVPLSDEDDIWMTHMKTADLAIEAVFEEMALKHRVIKDLERHIKPDCVIATNTSALSVAEIAKASKRPENVVGMHYFSPVPQMPLLEIILHNGTSDDVASRAVDVGLRQGKTCIVVKDVPGFYVNRCLGPYIAETLSLVESGVNLEHLDSLVTNWGLPVGPITLADEVGLDVAAHVNQTLSDSLGVRMHGGNAAIFQEMISRNFLGKKSGRGFYIHPKSKKEKKVINQEALNIVKRFESDKLMLSDSDIINRLVSRFANEAVLCVQEEIISSPEEGDIGAVFGIGFPPFIGGPFRFVDRIGSAKFNEMMLRFSDQYGEQFLPCQLIQDMAKTNKRFHND